MTVAPLYEHSIKMNDAAVKDFISKHVTASLEFTIRECVQTAARELIKPYVQSEINKHAALSVNNKELISKIVRQEIEAAVHTAIKNQLPGAIWQECKVALIPAVTDALAATVNDAQAIGEVSHAVAEFLTDENVPTYLRTGVKKQMTKILSSTRNHLISRKTT